MEPSLRYNPALDGLRAIAALLVVASHCQIPGFSGGFFGVDLFFVLSGFLITQLLTDEFGARGEIDLPGFYLRRLLRLAPPLLLMLAAYLAIAPTLWPQLTLRAHIRDVMLTVFYLSDYAHVLWGDPKVLQHSWSLSVEEHFYLIWPFAILLLARIKPRWRISALFAMYLLATAWRIFEYQHLGWTATYYRFDTRLSGLILGALLALWLPHNGQISAGSANAAGVFACAVFIPCLMMGYWGAPGALVWMVSLTGIAAAALLIAASSPNSWMSALLSAPPLVGIGLISYGVYLWHYPAALYLRIRLPWYETVPIVLALALTAASISYFMIERPLRRYRRGLNARRQNAADDVSATAPASATATTFS